MRYMLCLILLAAPALPLQDMSVLAAPPVKSPLQTPLARARYRAWSETVVLQADYELRLRTTTTSDTDAQKCPCNGTRVYKPDGRVVVQCPCFAKGKPCTCRPAGDSLPTVEQVLTPLTELGAKLQNLMQNPTVDVTPQSTNTELAEKLSALSKELTVDVVSPNFALNASSVVPVHAVYCTSQTCEPCAATTAWIKRLEKDVPGGWMHADYEDDKPANIRLAQVRGNRTPRTQAFQASQKLTVWPTWLFMRGDQVVLRIEGDAAIQLGRTDVLNKLIELNTAAQQPAVAAGPAEFGPSTWFSHDAPGTKPIVEQAFSILRQLLGDNGEIRVQLKPKTATAVVQVLLSDTTGLRVTTTPQLAADVVFDGTKIKVKFTDGRVQAYWRGVSGDIPGFQIDTKEILVPISGIAPDQVFRVLP